MKEEIANVVHAVLAQGLGLRERLLRGEAPAFDTEQSALLGLLLGEREARRWPEYGGEDFVPAVGAASESAPVGPFLGARYALVCWLDEMIILDTPWGQRWNENKLEMRLYATNDRAWKFWDQARLAADRQGSDALGAYYLCVMLGFTGDHGEETGQLAGWIASAREQLRRARKGQWRAPPGMEPGTSVPPLRGRRALRRMLLVASVVLLAAVPVVALFLARRLT